MSHPNLRTLFVAASQCKNMSRDIIRQHRNLSSDIAWGLYLVLAFISNPLRGTMSLVLTYNWRLFFCPHRRHSWFLPFSLNHLEPIPLWYQRLVKAWIFRATFQYSFDITSYVESQFPHRFFSFSFPALVTCVLGPVGSKSVIFASSQRFLVYNVC